MILVKRAGVHCPAVMFHHRKADTDLVKVATHQSMVINRIVDQMPTKDYHHVMMTLVGKTINTILSKTFYRFLKSKIDYYLRIVVRLSYSQTSSPTDNWNGFESEASEKRKEYKSDNNGANRKSTQSVASPDFDSFDVKSSKPKTAGGKTKKIEDDAWDLLNN